MFVLESPELPSTDEPVASLAEIGNDAFAVAIQEDGIEKPIERHNGSRTDGHAETRRVRQLQRIGCEDCFRVT